MTAEIGVTVGEPRPHSVPGSAGTGSGPFTVSGPPAPGPPAARPVPGRGPLAVRPTGHGPLSPLHSVADVCGPRGPAPVSSEGDVLSGAVVLQGPLDISGMLGGTDQPPAITPSSPEAAGPPCGACCCRGGEDAGPRAAGHGHRRAAQQQRHVAAARASGPLPVRSGRHRRLPGVPVCPGRGETWRPGVRPLK